MTDRAERGLSSDVFGVFAGESPLRTGPPAPIVKRDWNPQPWPTLADFRR